MIKKYKTKNKNYAQMNSTSNIQYQMTDEDLAKMHTVLLGMYKDLKSVCDKHGLKIIAGGGTALGAIRHKGFIPWDDDMDLAFTRDDFETLKKVFPAELGDNYYLLAPDSSAGANCFLARMMKKGTTLLNMIDEASPYPHGIYIDFTTLDNAPENKVMRRLKAFNADALRFISYSAYWYKYRSKSLADFMLNSEGKNYYRIRIRTGQFFSVFKTPEKWFSAYDRFIRGKRSSKLTFAAGRKKYWGEVLDYNVCFPLKKVPFEDTEIYVFNDVDAYLKMLYGDYHKIPDESHREKHLCLKLDFDREV